MDFEVELCGLRECIKGDLGSCSLTLVGSRSFESAYVDIIWE